MHYYLLFNNFYASIMTLVQLKHFMVLADLGTYVAASKALFLTQPALTRSIQSLEDDFGQALFDRVGRRIEITPFGQQVLVLAQNLVQDADHLKTVGEAIVERTYRSLARWPQLWAGCCFGATLDAAIC